MSTPTGVKRWSPHPKFSRLLAEREFAQVNNALAAENEAAQFIKGHWSVMVFGGEKLAMWQVEDITIDDSILDIGEGVEELEEVLNALEAGTHIKLVPLVRLRGSVNEPEEAITTPIDGDLEKILTAHGAYEAVAAVLESLVSGGHSRELAIAKLVRWTRETANDWQG